MEGVIVRPRQPQNIELKLARYEQRRAELQELERFAEKLLDNPIFELIVWTLFIQWFRGQSDFWLANIGEEMLNAAGVGVITAKAIAPLVPYIAQGAESIGGLVKSVGSVAAMAAL